MEKISCIRKPAHGCSRLQSGAMALADGVHEHGQGIDFRHQQGFDFGAVKSTVDGAAQTMLPSGQDQRHRAQIGHANSGFFWQNKMLA